MSIIARNRKAQYEYEIIKTYEAGISLIGSEVRSARLGQAQITDGYARITPVEAIVLHNIYIAPYKRATLPEYDPYRPRQLLLHHEEIHELKMAIQSQSNLTITPLSMYTSPQGLIKIELGLARGKKQHEKKKRTQERDLRREIDRTLKNLPS